MIRGLGRGGRPGEEFGRVWSEGGDGAAREEKDGFPELTDIGDMGRIARREMTR